MHCSEDVLLCRLAHGILLVVCQEHHVFSRIPKVSIQICGHILDVVYAPSELTLLTKVIDANQQCFSPTCAERVLEIVPLRCAVSESLLPLGWRWGSVVIALNIGVCPY